MLSNYGSFTIFGIANFVLVGYLVRKLGSDAFGVISLLVSLTILTDLLGSGVCQAVTKHVSAAIGREERTFANRLISTSLLWFSICGLIGAAALGVISFHIERIFDIPAELISDARLGMWLMALRVLICFPFNSYQGVLLAYQRYDLTNLARSLTIVLRVAAVIGYFEVFSASISTFIIITIVFSLIERMLWVVFSYRVLHALQIKISLISRKSLAILVGFGGFMFIIHIGNMIGYEAVKWVIGIELDVINVGGYTLIASLAVVAGELARSVSKVLVPVSSRYNSLNLHEKNVQLGFLGTKYTMIVANSLCVTPLLMLKPFLSLWVGKEYPQAYISHIALLGIVLLGGQWFISTAVCLIQMMTGIGRIRFAALVTISWAVCGLGVAWAYLHWVQSSMFAIVLTMTLARIVGSIAHLVYGMHVLGIRRIHFLLQAIFKPTLAGIAACGVSAVSMSYLDVFHITGFVLTAVIVMLVYLLATWIIALSAEERRGIINKLWFLMKQL